MGERSAHCGSILRVREKGRGRRSPSPFPGAQCCAILLVRLLVGSLRVLVPLLAVLLRRRRVRLRLVVLAHLVVVGGLEMVVGGRGVVRRRLVMALVGGMFARCGHVGPTFRYCGRAPGAPWPAEQSIGQDRCRWDMGVSGFPGVRDARDNHPLIAFPSSLLKKGVPTQSMPRKTGWGVVRQMAHQRGPQRASGARAAIGERQVANGRHVWQCRSPDPLMLAGGAETGRITRRAVREPSVSPAA